MRPFPIKPLDRELGCSPIQEYFLRCRTLIEADEISEFRVVVQAIEIGIFSRPIPVPKSGCKGFFQCIQGLGFFPEDTVRTCSIVEGIGIAWAEGDGSLQVPDTLFVVVSGVCEVGGQ